MRNIRVRKTEQVKSLFTVIGFGLLTIALVFTIGYFGSKMCNTEESCKEVSDSMTQVDRDIQHYIVIPIIFLYTGGSIVYLLFSFRGKRKIKL